MKAKDFKKLKEESRKYKTLFFDDSVSASRRVEYLIHSGEGVDINVFPVVDGVNAGRWLVHYEDLTARSSTG